MRIVIIFSASLIFSLLGPAIAYLFSGFFPVGLSDSFRASLVIAGALSAAITGVLCGVLYAYAYKWKVQPKTISIALYSALCGFILTGLMVVLLQQGFYRSYLTFITGLAALGGLAGFICSLIFALFWRVVIGAKAVESEKS